jgi:hypothetical protein
VLPATCPSSIPVGNYSFNGTGFGLTSGAISSVFNVSGLIQFGGINNITLTEYVTSSAGIATVSATGTYAVLPGCLATATILDLAGTSYSLVLKLTSATGENFAITSTASTGIFSGSGRPL